LLTSTPPHWFCRAGYDRLSVLHLLRHRCRRVSAPAEGKCWLTCLHPTVFSVKTGGEWRASGTRVWSEQGPDGVSCSASSRTSLTGLCTVRVMAHARRAQNAFSVARRLNCKSLLLLLTTYCTDMSSRRHECIQATASSLRCACPLASASPPTPLNQFDILRGALQRMRLNTAFLRHVTICDMTLQAPICVDSGCFSSSKLAGSCDFQQHLSRVDATLSVKTILLSYHLFRHRFHI